MFIFVKFAAWPHSFGLQMNEITLSKVFQRLFLASLPSSDFLTLFFVLYIAWNFFHEQLLFLQNYKSKCICACLEKMKKVIFTYLSGNSNCLAICLIGVPGCMTSANVILLGSTWGDLHNTICCPNWIFAQYEIIPSDRISTITAGRPN
jgi:hypothetical protein